MKRRRDISSSLSSIVEHLKGAILAAIVIVAVLGVIVGYRYYRFSQDDPRYCASCHLMKEAFTEW